MNFFLIPSKKKVRKGISAFLSRYKFDAKLSLFLDFFFLLLRKIQCQLSPVFFVNVIISFCFVIISFRFLFCFCHIIMIRKIGGGDRERDLQEKKCTVILQQFIQIICCALDLVVKVI